MPVKSRVRSRSRIWGYGHIHQARRPTPRSWPTSHAPFPACPRIDIISPCLKAIRTVAGLDLPLPPALSTKWRRTAPLPFKGAALLPLDLCFLFRSSTQFRQGTGLEAEAELSRGQCARHTSFWDVLPIQERCQSKTCISVQMAHRLMVASLKSGGTCSNR